MHIESVVILSELGKYHGQWTALTENALEANINYEPAPLMAALSYLPINNWEVLLCWHNNLLVGLFPLERKRSLPLPLPIQQYATLYNGHFMSCVPLVHHQYVDKCLDAFWDWFGRGWRPRLLLISEAVEGSAYRSALHSSIATNQLVAEVVDSTSRAAMLNTASTFEEYFSTQFGTKSRSTIRRKRKQIEQKGTWRVSVTQPKTAHWESAFAAFISVEASGWKGKEGSAIGKNPNIEKFIRELSAYAQAHGRLFLAMAYVDDMPVAGQLGLINGSTILIYKLGFDENHSKESPGILLMVDIVKYVLSQSTYTSIDSCARPNLEMFNRCLA